MNVIKSGNKKSIAKTVRRLLFDIIYSLLQQYYTNIYNILHKIKIVVVYQNVNLVLRSISSCC